jgi:hypothetical protein
LDLGKKRLLEVRSSNSDLPDFVGVRANSNSKQAIEGSPAKVKVFTEKSFERWSKYVCGICRHLVFHREKHTWVCDKGYSITKEYCGDWVDGSSDVRIRMRDGVLMYLDSP